MMNGVKYPRIQHFLSLFPAQAGMIPPRTAKKLKKNPFPRASGDDPDNYDVDDFNANFSPRKRG